MRRALVAVLLVGSCAGRGLDVPGPPDASAQGPQTYDAFTHDYAEAICARYVACGLMDPAQTAACIASTLNAGLPVPPEPHRGLASGAYVYAAEGAAACLVAVATSTCRFPSVPCGEFDVLRPTRDTGASCDSNEVCASASCLCDASSASGVCTLPAQVGQPCSPGCVDGAICSAARSCVPVPAGGEPCTGACTVGFFCIANDDGSDICRPAGAVGAPCTALDGDVRGQEGCDEGTACDFTQDPPVCALVAPEGAPCGSVEGCAEGLACVGLDVAFEQGARPSALPGGIAGTCRPPLHAGSACPSEATFDACPAFTTCVKDVCTPTPVLGGSCAAYPYCIAAFCDPDTMICVPSIAEGQPCDASLERGPITQCGQDGSGYASPGLFCDGFAGTCGSNAAACE